MSRWVLELIKQEMQVPGIPEYVLMNRDDILFLLELIEHAEELALFTAHGEKNGSQTARKLMERWRELLSHDA